MSDEGIGSARWRRWLLPAVAVLAVTIHLPALDGRFVNWDDEWLVVENTHLDGPGAVRRILDPTAYRQAFGAEYLPVRDLSVLVDRQLWDLNPLGHHLQSLLLYGVLCTLVLAVLRDLTGSAVAAGAGALLFAVHPIHVENVAWISERKGLLAGVFLLAAFLVLRRGRGPGATAAAVGLYLLAALSKSTVHFFPLFLVALDGIESRRDGCPFRLGRALLRTLPFAVVSVAAVALNAFHQSESGAVYGWGGATAVEAVAIVGSAATRSAIHLLVPVGLSAEYLVEPGILGVAAAAGIALGLVAVGVLAWRAGPLAPAAVWMVLAWLPVSNLVALPNPMADRYLLLPSIGAAGLAGILFERAARWRRVRRGCLAVVVVALAVLSVDRCSVWSDSRTLWRDAVAKAPGSGRAWQNLGAALLREGRTEEAFASFRRMVEVEPDRGEWWEFLASKLTEAGDPGGAETTLREGLRRHPGFAPIRIALARILLERGMRDPSAEVEAERLLLEIVDDPGDQPRTHRAVAYSNLGVLHLTRGRLEKGVGLTRTALEVGLPPTYARTALQNLVEAYRRLDRPREVRRYEAMLRALEGRLGAR